MAEFREFRVLGACYATCNYHQLNRNPRAYICISPQAYTLMVQLRTSQGWWETWFLATAAAPLLGLDLASTTCP